VHENDSGIGSLVLGVVMAVLSLFGLAMASGAKDDVFYGTGLGLFVFCVLFIFVLIHQRVGH
jgi:ABC-type multidrug transport system permease subunit